MGRYLLARFSFLDRRSQPLIPLVMPELLSEQKLGAGCFRQTKKIVQYFLMAVSIIQKLEDTGTGRQQFLTLYLESIVAVFDCLAPSDAIPAGGYKCNAWEEGSAAHRSQDAEIGQVGTLKPCILDTVEVDDATDMVLTHGPKLLCDLLQNPEILLRCVPICKTRGVDNGDPFSLVQKSVRLTLRCVFVMK